VIGYTVYVTDGQMQQLEKHGIARRSRIRAFSARCRLNRGRERPVIRQPDGCLSARDLSKDSSDRDRSGEAAYAPSPRAAAGNRGRERMVSVCLE